MELRDLIVTPFIIAFAYFVGYLIKPRVTDRITVKYFIPALTVKILGALALGFIYQFYYSGGDTFNFHTHGSRHIWEAFMDSPAKGMKLLFSDGDQVGVYEYSSKILFFNDPPSYFIIRLATIFDLITFSSYSATAIFFALIAFAGSWMLFITFYELNPNLHRTQAIATLFVPSVFFWGSGLMKDTITMACVSIATFIVYRLFILGSFSLVRGILLIFAFYVLFVVKIYILLAFLPAVIFWVFLFHFSKVKSTMLRVVSFPLLLMLTVTLGYYAVLKAGEDNAKYSLGVLAKTAQVTAYDIRFWTGRDAGSGYSLGELDGTWGSLFRLAPQAINVSLFRPYLWEIKNPLMLLSGLESLCLLLLTVYLFFRNPFVLLKSLREPTILFCVLFSITFAFAVGISTYNFGSLVRYKIPLMPFYLVALILIADQTKRARKFAVLEDTE